MGVLNGGILGSSSGGSGGVSNPLTADLDVDSFTIKSTSGDVTLEATDTAGGDVLILPDATGGLIVRQDGGTPGSDELTISESGGIWTIEAHEGTNGNLKLKSNDILNFSVVGKSDLTFAPKINGFYSNNGNYDLGRAGASTTDWRTCYLSVSVSMQETTTPSAVADRGAFYCKSDNKAYFQDGAGTEHEIAFV